MRQTLSIIVPARNEAKMLPSLLNSLKDQLEQSDEIIVVDDQSEDETTSVARQQGAEVILSKQLPAGWQGKTWACYQGAQLAKGNLLLFIL